MVSTAKRARGEVARRHSSTHSVCHIARAEPRVPISRGGVVSGEAPVMRGVDAGERDVALLIQCPFEARGEWLGCSQAGAGIRGASSYTAIYCSATTAMGCDIAGYNVTLAQGE